MRAFIDYMRRRLNERTTYAGIGAVVSGAALLPAPWSYIFVGVGLLGVFIPTSTGV